MGGCCQTSRYWSKCQQFNTNGSSIEVQDHHFPPEIVGKLERDAKDSTDVTCVHCWLARYGRGHCTRSLFPIHRTRILSLPTFSIKPRPSPGRTTTSRVGDLGLGKNKSGTEMSHDALPFFVACGLAGELKGKGSPSPPFFPSLQIVVKNCEHAISCSVLSSRRKAR